MGKIKFAEITLNEDDRNELTYPPELEHDLKRPLTIEVHAPYNFKTEDGVTFVVADWLSDWANEPKGEILEAAYQNGRKVILYNPFERFDQDTFIKTVMAIDINNTDSVLKFYNEHGPLGFMEMPEGRRPGNSPKIFGINVETAMEKYGFFRMEIIALRTLLMYQEAISNKDDNYFREYFQVPPNTPENQALLMGKKALMNLISEKLDLIQPVVMLSKEGEFYKGSTAFCLLGVFYIRLYEIITENKKLIKCRYCGDISQPRKSNATFCPPPEANGRSKCANRYDAMVQRRLNS
jgi:hypothetical protein